MIAVEVVRVGVGDVPAGSPVVVTQIARVDTAVVHLMLERSQPVPELARPEMHAAIGPAIVGSLVAGVGAYFSVRFLVRYFETRTLTPFAIYCVVFGLAMVIYNA